MIFHRRFIALRFLYGSCLILRLAHWKVTDGILISALVQVVDLGAIVLVQCISGESMATLSFLYLILDEYFAFLFFLLFDGLQGILNVNRVSYSVDLIFVLGHDIH